MQKNTSIIVITLVMLFVALLAVLFLWRSGDAPYVAPAGNQPVTPAPAPQDTAAAISGDLQGIDAGDLDKEFKDIDTNLNNL